jgi:hypothetical protein
MTPAQLPLFPAGNIRLSCEACGAERDGVSAVPAGWVDVHRVRSLAESRRTRPRKGEDFTLMRWETHTGLCPECKEEEQ